MDKSLDGPRGLHLLTDSIDGTPHTKRRGSHTSNTTSSTENDAYPANQPDSPSLRGVEYLRSWLFVVRRALTTYYFLTSFVLLFCFGIKV